MNQKSVKTIILGIAFLISFNIHAADELIQLDIGTGATAPGGNWNTVVTGTTSNLIDFNTGLATPISVTIAGATQQANTGFAGTKDWVEQSVTADGTFNSNAAVPQTVTFGGLTETAYNVEVVSSFGSNFNGAYDVQLESTFADRNFNNTPGVDGDDFLASTDGRIPENWLIWDEVAPSSGQLTVSGFGGGNRTFINAVRLAAIPEPGTYLMFATVLFGAIFLTIRNRKKENEESGKVDAMA